MVQGTEIREQGSGDLRADSGSHLLPDRAGERVRDRVRELEAENARLKSLVGELLVTNQRLRDCGATSQ
jgi:hypothetical protein